MHCCIYSNQAYRFSEACCTKASKLSGVMGSGGRGIGRQELVGTLSKERRNIMSRSGLRSRIEGVFGPMI